MKQGCWSLRSYKLALLYQLRRVPGAHTGMSGGELYHSSDDSWSALSPRDELCHIIDIFLLRINCHTQILPRFLSLSLWWCYLHRTPHRSGCAPSPMGAFPPSQHPRKWSEFIRDEVGWSQCERVRPGQNTSHSTRVTAFSVEKGWPGLAPGLSELRLAEK